MSRIRIGAMVVLFWTGVSGGPAGAASGRGAPEAAVAQADVIAASRSDIDACDAGVQARCAPVLY